MKKLGATPSDRAYIKRRALAGASPEAISDECNVILEVVKNFMPDVGNKQDEQKGRKRKATKASRKTESQADSGEELQLEVATSEPEKEMASEAEPPSEQPVNRVRARRTS